MRCSRIEATANNNILVMCGCRSCFSTTTASLMVIKKKATTTFTTTSTATVARYLALWIAEKKKRNRVFCETSSLFTEALL
jgi:hypothetical protein